MVDVCLIRLEGAPTPRHELLVRENTEEAKLSTFLPSRLTP